MPRPLTAPADLQAAINELAALRGGGTLDLEGVFVIEQPLTLPVLAGGGLPRIRLRGNLEASLVCYTESYAVIPGGDGFGGLSLDGLYVEVHGGSGLLLGQYNRSSIVDCTFTARDGAKSALVTTTTYPPYGLLVQNNGFNNFVEAIAIPRATGWPCNGWILIGNDFEGNGIAIRGDWIGYWTMLGRAINGSTACGLRFAGYGNRFITHFERNAVNVEDLTPDDGIMHNIVLASDPVNGFTGAIANKFPLRWRSMK